MREYKSNIPFPKNIRVILWDFDGVIMDSMPVRDKGFEIVLSNHSREEIDLLLNFHRENGGLSRYVKFRYFFEEIKKERVSEDEVNTYAQKFSVVMLENLIDQQLLISEAVSFIRMNYEKFNMHIVSGSDQKELRHICKELDIYQFFHSINGSPTPKKKLVQNLLQENNYKPEETILIGDSINDYEAAIENNIGFWGYNNPSLKQVAANYIQQFE